MARMFASPSVSLAPIEEVIIFAHFVFDVSLLLPDICRVANSQHAAQCLRC